jgi:two-component system response regulator RegA
MKLLLVDDDQVFAAVLARVLTRRGLTVDQVHTAPDALQTPPGHYDRILLDLNLGVDSGLKLLPQLKQRHPESAIVVLTGYASIATAVEATKLGAVQYLSKPASADEILHAFASMEPNPEISLSAQPMSIKRVTWEHLQRVLAEHQGNISATARALNMHRRTLQRMLAKKPVQE